MILAGYYEKKQFMNLHWNYFISLERDLENLSRYIEFAEANFQTYSTELVRIYLAAGSEIDVLLRQLCSLVAPEVKVESIKGYRKIITEHYPEIAKEKVYIRSYTLTFEPWKDWQNNIASMEPNPEWWTAHNKVKHRRHEAYQQANLKNVMDAVAALLILNFHFIKTNYPIKLESVVYENITPKPCLFYFSENKYIDYNGLTMRMQISRLSSRRW